MPIPDRPIGREVICVVGSWIRRETRRKADGFPLREKRGDFETLGSGNFDDEALLRNAIVVRTDPIKIAARHRCLRVSRQEEKEQKAAEREGRAHKR